MPQRDDLIEEIKRTDLLLEWAVQNGDEAEAERLREMLRAIREEVDALYVPGTRYRKTGIVFFGLEKPGTAHQTDLFDRQGQGILRRPGAGREVVAHETAEAFAPPDHAVGRAYDREIGVPQGRDGSPWYAHARGRWLAAQTVKTRHAATWRACVAKQTMHEAAFAAGSQITISPALEESCRRKH